MQEVIYSPEVSGPRLVTLEGDPPESRHRHGMQRHGGHTRGDGKQTPDHAKPCGCHSSEKKHNLHLVKPPHGSGAKKSNQSEQYTVEGDEELYGLNFGGLFGGKKSRLGASGKLVRDAAMATIYQQNPAAALALYNKQKGKDQKRQKQIKQYQTVGKAAAFVGAGIATGGLSAAGGLLAHGAGALVSSAGSLLSSGGAMVAGLVGKAGSLLGVSGLAKITSTVSGGLSGILGSLSPDAAKKVASDPVALNNVLDTVSSLPKDANGQVQPSDVLGALQDKGIINASDIISPQSGMVPVSDQAGTLGQSQSGTDGGNAKPWYKNWKIMVPVAGATATVGGFVIYKMVSGGHK